MLSLRSLKAAVAVFGLVAIGCFGHALFGDELEIEAVPQMLSPRGSPKRLRAGPRAQLTPGCRPLDAR
ncbi:hypothetical protein [Natronorubrum sp. A-ect3]|uniref:hypothetical protein n=1 Tax=Natronorubrum sp. A-ect3 TaxID=3242698 RepID=UPI00359EB129